MVKTATQVAEKMRSRVSGSGKYLKEGMQAGTDPLDVLSRNPTAYAQKLQAGVTEAIRKGSYEAGIKKAKANDSWKKSVDRAGAHFEEAAPRMVENAMKDYDQRATVIKAAQDKVAPMATTTRAQRIAKAAAYAEASGAGYDALYGRKA